MSLRRRLLLGIFAIAAVLVVTNAALSNTIESFLIDRVDRQLVDVASRPLFRPRDGRPAIEERTVSEYFIAVARQDGGLIRLTSAFDDGDGSPALSEADIREHAVPRGVRPRPFTAEGAEGGADWRMVALTGPRQAIVTVIGLSLEDVHETVRRIRTVQILGTLGALAALGLVSWWMVRLGVHPLEEVARTADAIAAGRWSDRVGHDDDATEAGRLGRAFNAMLERIESAFRARETSEGRLRQFAADASHELRTPLTSIRGYAELWRRGGLREEAELADAMRRIEAEATRMGALVEDLLLLARLDQMRPLDRVPVRLDAVVADAVRDLTAIERDRHVEVTTEPAVVTGDEDRLRQLVANLLANVRDHTPPSAGVRVSVARRAEQVVLTVSDDGPGMAPEVAKKVFERFFRSDPARGRHSGGSGLGLAIVAAVAEAHGGTATVDSAVGEGTTFTVILPAERPEVGSQDAREDPASS